MCLSSTHLWTIYWFWHRYQSIVIPQSHAQTPSSRTGLSSVSSNQHPQNDSLTLLSLQRWRSLGEVGMSVWPIVVCFYNIFSRTSHSCYGIVERQALLLETHTVTSLIRSCCPLITLIYRGLHYLDHETMEIVLQVDILSHVPDNEQLLPWTSKETGWADWYKSNVLSIMHRSHLEPLNW